MVRIVIKSLAVIAYMSLDLSRQCSAGMLINQHQESPAKDESAFRNDVKLACCTVICDKSELDKFCWCGTIDSSKLKQLLTERGVKDTPKLDEIKSLIMPVVSEWKDIELELENLCELEKKAEGNPKDNEARNEVDAAVRSISETLAKARKLREAIILDLQKIDPAVASAMSTFLWTDEQSLIEKMHSYPNKPSAEKTEVEKYFAQHFGQKIE
ncbi:hypothetical protein ABG067_003481 [Albugo candida]